MPSNPPSRLSRFEASLPIIEAVIWIVIAWYSRRLVDLLAGRWQVLEPWVTLIKVGVVLALIALAVWLHTRVYRWLASKGWIHPE